MNTQTCVTQHCVSQVYVLLSVSRLPFQIAKESEDEASLFFWIKRNTACFFTDGRLKRIRCRKWGILNPYDLARASKNHRTFCQKPTFFGAMPSRSVESGNNSFNESYATLYDCDKDRFMVSANNLISESMRSLTCIISARHL